MPEQENTPSSVTKKAIEANIISEYYFTATEGVIGSDHTGQSVSIPETLDLLTFCVLILRNGFKVTGESACVSRAIFDAEKGRKYAREKAVEKCWELMGCELATQQASSRDSPSKENHCEY